MTRSAGSRAAIAAVAVAGSLALSSAPATAHGPGCGESITRDTTLQRNLINCPGDGLVIDADNITLDLNGHTIDGNRTGAPDCELTATGVSNPDGHDGITIKNGTVRQFGQGIGGGFGRSVLRGLTVRDNRGNGIGMGAFAPDNLDDNRIEHNLLARNDCGGVNLTGTHRVRIAGNRIEDGGVALIGVSDAVVERNSASGGDGAGIFGFDVRRSRIEHNAVSHALDGVFLYFSNDNLVLENAAWGNHFGGISVKASANNLISRNSTWDNAAGVGLDPEDGLVDRSTDNTVSHNRSVHDGVGVLVLAGDRNRIVGNRVSDALELPGSSLGPLNDGFGIRVVGGNGNVMAANVIERTVRDGIQVLGTPEWGTAAGNPLRGNVVRRAGDDGIDVETPASMTPPTTLTGNLALRNAKLGIKAGPGVTDGGGNRAFGNGDPAQCSDDIACA